MLAVNSGNYPPPNPTPPSLGNCKWRYLGEVNFRFYVHPSSLQVRETVIGGSFIENMDLHYREQMFVFKNTSFDVEQKNRRFNENDICDGEKGSFILNFVSMFKRAARCAYRAKFRAIKLRRWQRVCKSVMTKVEAKVSGKGNLSQSNLGYFCQELSCCQYFWMAVIAGCPGKVRADCIFGYSL